MFYDKECENDLPIVCKSDEYNNEMLKCVI